LDQVFSDPYKSSSVSTERPTADAELRGREPGGQLGNAGAAYVPEGAMLDREGHPL